MRPRRRPASTSHAPNPRDHRREHRPLQVGGVTMRRATLRRFLGCACVAALTAGLSPSRPRRRPGRPTSRSPCRSSGFRSPDSSIRKWKDFGDTDREFDGHGPDVVATATLNGELTSRKLTVTLCMTATEPVDNWTKAPSTRPNTPMTTTTTMCSTGLVPRTSSSGGNSWVTPCTRTMPATGPACTSKRSRSSSPRARVDANSVHAAGSSSGSPASTAASSRCSSRPGSTPNSSMRMERARR